MDERIEQICGCSDEDTVCTNIIAQYTDVSLPVTMKPSAAIADVEATCCGDPVVTVRQACGCGKREITITQSLCIKITIEYGATVEAGEPAINCKCTSGNGCPPCR